MRGFTRERILELAQRKNDVKWVKQLRLKGLETYQKMAWPEWGPDLAELKVAEIEAYIEPKTQMVQNWAQVPAEIRQVFEDLGIPQAERAGLAGVGTQYDSELVYHNLKKRVRGQGIVYLGIEEAIRSRQRVMFRGKRREIRSLVREYFMKLVPVSDHKFAALHAATWSGGSFVLVPNGVRVELPLQSYFRLNAPGAGQFEHTLILVDEGAELNFIEGCSAPRYNVANLHAGCVELYVGKNAHLKFSTVESWSKNMFNLNTKRAYVEAGGVMEWVTGSFGSQVSMLYPTTLLAGEGARMTYKGVSLAGAGQNLDTGVKVIHLANKTYSDMDVRSLAKDGGVATTRSLVKVGKEASGVRSFLDCKSLILDEYSRADTAPKVEVLNATAAVGHEAAVGQISDEEIFYLKSRGLSEREARTLVVRGFTDGVSSELPVEYAMEMNRLIGLEMEK